MAEVTTEDKALVMTLIDCADCEQEHAECAPGLAGEEAHVAAYREQKEQAARDETARKAFAAMCHFCAGDYSKVYADGSGWRPGKNGGALCTVPRTLRLALDPDDRLAGGAK